MPTKVALDCAPFRVFENGIENQKRFALKEQTSFLVAIRLFINLSREELQCLSVYI